jgi:hypothetical protein
MVTVPSFVILLIINHITRRRIPEMSYLYNYCFENLKSSILVFNLNLDFLSRVVFFSTCFILGLLLEWRGVV